MYDCVVSSTVVVIGFEQTEYETEEGMVVEVCAELLSGTLERDALVVASSSDGTAIGMCVCVCVHTASVRIFN